MKQVTESDLRLPEYRDAKIEDLEFRDDGKVVRKDRWEQGIRSIAATLGLNEFEVSELVTKVAAMSINAAVTFEITQFLDVYPDELLARVESMSDRLKACEMALCDIAGTYMADWGYGVDPMKLASTVRTCRYSPPVPLPSPCLPTTAAPSFLEPRASPTPAPAMPAVVVPVGPPVKWAEDFRFSPSTTWAWTDVANGIELTRAQLEAAGYTMDLAARYGYITFTY